MEGGGAGLPTKILFFAACASELTFTSSLVERLFPGDAEGRADEADVCRRSSQCSHCDALLTFRSDVVWQHSLLRTILMGLQVRVQANTY